MNDKEQLLALHKQVIQFHLDADVDSWLEIETAEYISANRGVISYPTKEERRAGRTPYLQATTFTEYQDVVEPVVKISEDGSLGWVIVQVKVSGIQKTSDGQEHALAFESAWIELYEKKNGRWLCVGNVSNMKPQSN